jgi:hypothetical protein
MWSYQVTYRYTGTNGEYMNDFVKYGGLYHWESVARSMLQMFLAQLSEEYCLIDSKMVFVPTKEVEEYKRRHN